VWQATSSEREAGCLYHGYGWFCVKFVLYKLFVSASMSAVERFRQAWNAKFPSEPPPDLPCLHASPDQPRPESDSHGSVYGTVYSNLNSAAVGQTLQACNATIEQLHRQLERQQFVAEYLWEVLHGINTVSVADFEPAPLVPRQSVKTPLRVKDRPAAVPLETDLSAAGSRNSGLDNIVPIQESPSSNFSPLSLNSVDGKVFPEDKTAGLTYAESSDNPVAACNSTDFEKTQQPVHRKHSLPLLEREQSETEFESDTERTRSVDSDLKSNVSVATETNMATPVNVPQHKRVTPSPSLPGHKAHRQKPVPTPRVTVSKPAAYVNLDDGNVGESSTDEVTSFGGNDELQREAKRAGGSDSFNQSSTRNTAHGSASSDSVPPADEDQKVRSVKERALAFASSAASTTPSSLPGSGQKPTASDNLSPADSFSPHLAGLRRAKKVHVYEEVVPVKPDQADSDEAGMVSSDDEEPLYYNLKMLQKNMLNRAKTFYSKGAERPRTEHSKQLDVGGALETRLKVTEDDTHQLSGDSSKYL